HQDQLIPLRQGEKLMIAGAARSKELQAIPGADHNSLIAVGGIFYFQAIKQFIDKVTGADDWQKRRKEFKEKNQ
ncbi:MAG: alpha/beta hydrolase, partial [Desulfobulbaceae bacterium]|nr:alpha/beta hydrolase [Desulfobulbaceae bacterium]